MRNLIGNRYVDKTNRRWKASKVNVLFGLVFLTEEYRIDRKKVVRMTTLKRLQEKYIKW